MCRVEVQDWPMDRGNRKMIAPPPKSRAATLRPGYLTLSSTSGSRDSRASLKVAITVEAMACAHWRGKDRGNVEEVIKPSLLTVNVPTGNCRGSLVLRVPKMFRRPI